MAKSRPTKSKSSPEKPSPEKGSSGKSPAAKRTGRTAPASGRGSTASDTPSLEQLDLQILRLLNQRADRYQQMAAAKPTASQHPENQHPENQHPENQHPENQHPEHEPPEHGPPGSRHEAGPAVASQADSESDSWSQLERVIETNPGPLSQRCIRGIFRELISGSRALVQPIRAAYLGPPYSYSHVAALERFGESADLVPVGTIAAVFESIERGQANFGLVPIENSTDGRIVDTLDMFARRPARICGEVQLRIHHCLLGKGSRSDILEVHSKPQALSQCRGWLARHLPAARTVEMTSTASAAKLAAERPGSAAIASRLAGTHYGLDVIEANIEDNRHNITRFAVIGDSEPRRTGRDKTSLMFELRHQPGALADAMAIFKRNRLNLTWIESFPRPGAPQEYLFFVELEGHRSEMKVKRALASLESKTPRLVVLGSYARCEPIG
jgi:chorismate mutase/prephenate dehydratase